jgi:hypothetical protein
MSSKGKGFKPLVLGLLMSEKEKEGLIRERLAEKVQRLNALADSMGIPKGDSRWFQLALELAQLYVPELKTSRKDGAKTKWDIGQKLVLAHLVARRMRTHELNKAQACAALAEDDHWLSNIRGKPDGNALVKQCPSETLQVALRERDEAEQVGMIEDLDALIDKGRTLMIEIASETSFA